MQVQSHGSLEVGGAMTPKAKSTVEPEEHSEGESWGVVDASPFFLA